MPKQFGKVEADARIVKINSLDSHLNCTHILYGTAQRHQARWAGHMSLKSFNDGQAFYDAGTGRYEVDDSAFLLLNEHQPYTITIDTEKPIIPFIVFFETNLAEEVYRSLTAKTHRLLDDPAKHKANKICPETLFAQVDRRCFDGA